MGIGKDKFGLYEGFCQEILKLVVVELGIVDRLSVERSEGHLV